MVSARETEENIVSKSAAILSTIAICLSVIVAGCTSGQQTTVPIPQPHEMPMQAPPSMEQPPLEPSKTEKDQSSEMMMTDKKPMQQQMQEMMHKLLADGMYSDIVTYRYHSGIEHVNITLEIKDDIITAASVVGIHPHKTSARYQENFNSALPNLVVGKRIDELYIPRQVSGSSLTTAAFKNYVNSLISQ